MGLTEVCEYLNISRTTAYTRIREGVLVPLPESMSGATKIPRYKFDRATVERLRNAPQPGRTTETKASYDPKN